MKFVEIILISLCGCLLPCEGQLDGGFWWLKSDSNTEDITTTTTTTTQQPTTEEVLLQKKAALEVDEIICCECVPYYQCPNGTISTDGEGIIEVRFGPASVPTPLVNVEVCPGLDICCAPPNVDPLCKLRSEDLYGPILPSDTLCECIVYDQCDDGLVVSDGGGNTSITMQNGRIASHSLCQHSLDVCCYVPPYEEFPPDVIPSEDDPLCDCVEFYLCGNDGYITTDGGGLIDVRIKVEPSNNIIPLPCVNNETLVCCYHRPDDVIEVPVPVVTIAPKPPLTDVSSTYSPIDYSDCNCVEFYLCDDDGFIVEDGAGILNVRIRPVSSTPKPIIPCPDDNTLVCCRHRNEPVIDEVTTPTSPRAASKCAVRNSGGIGTRILGFGESETQFGEFPWVVTLLKSHYITGELYPLFQGGATLIHPRVVLTAAHKVAKLAVEEVLVRLGDWDVASEKETFPYQQLGVVDIITHPGFNSRSLAHDVALLILQEDAKLNFHIQPICLAKDVLEVDPTDCITNGWGVDEHMTGDYQLIMKKATVPLMTNARCQKLLRNTRLSKYFKLHSSFICAGGELGADTCKGDGGGPLACRVKDDPFKYLQVGITAWGIGCGEKDIPGVYVDIPSHYQWIQDSLEPYVTDLEPYFEKNPLSPSLTK